jgi:hypothetical protein
MDKVVFYQNCIIKILERYGKEKPVNLQDVENQLITDTTHHHYQLQRVGWQDGKFIHYLVFHFDIKNGKIWLQRNNTEINFAEELIELGVPKEDIVLGFQPEYARPFTGYGVS